MTSNLRREQILDVAKRSFARQGYAGTTTRSLAAAAGVSEALLFKHFPTKAALYAEILAEVCESDPGLIDLRALQPSTATLVRMVREMVSHFFAASDSPDSEDAQRLNLIVSSHLQGGEFARILFQRVGEFIEPIFGASLASAIDVGDARPSGAPSRDLFWFVHHSLTMLAMTRMPSLPTITYSDASGLDRQMCEFILRGIGVSDAAIARHFLTDAIDAPSLLIAQGA